IPGERTFVPTTVQLVKMLDSDRIDTMVEWDLVAENVIRNLKVMSIHKLSPPIKVQPFHIYIHKKHQALIPEIVQVLKDMKEDGAFDKIKIDVLGKFNLN
ncbi:MAG: transporter substrate-binding domain-containing protein, partial [Candidatus Pacebacteria bacterium]|nr:transporter substrate-binding domain-containing protein [Candidatus Paceibacterota bacterium]